MATSPVVLAVLDGWGVTPPGEGNMIEAAETPIFDSLSNRFPRVSLKAFGESVGLPWQEMGNSEVGHLNIGAGRIVYQDLVKISKSIDEGEFAKNPAFKKAMDHVKKNDSSLHVIGCASDGGIHGHIAHGEALLEIAKHEKVEKVFFHLILDGRDSPRDTAPDFIRGLKKRMRKLRTGEIASMGGRFFGMDRNEHWDRIAAAYHAIADGEGPRTKDPLKTLKESYEQGVYDEEIPPTVVEKKGDPIATVSDGDAVIFFNFRSDRAKQLTKAFVLPGIDDKIDRKNLLDDLLFVTFTEYDKNLPVEVAFQTDLIPNSIGEVLADAGKKQLRTAETEKFAHITVFFSAGRIDPFKGEERVLVPSPPVKSYDEQPEMSADLVADGLVMALDAGKHDFYLVNFANVDMVGHTANTNAAKKGIETVDAVLGRIWEKLQELGGALLVTADHGNAEVMVNLRTGDVDKGHTANPVPFLMCVPGREMESSADAQPLWALEPVGVLADVAPTVLDVMGIPIPKEMTGISLLEMI